jgi:Fibronectin type III domain
VSHEYGKTKTDQSVEKFPSYDAGGCFHHLHSCFHEIYNNTNFNVPQAPALPVDQATLKSANDALAVALAAAVDGGKKAIAQKLAQKEVVVKLLMQLAHYVESNCKDDMTIFLSSGFTAASSSKTKTPPVSDSIRSIDSGPNSGQMQIVLMKYPGAVSYEVRWSPVASGGVPNAWTNQPVANLRPASTISGLTPATTYVFQARAVTKAGYSDWSDSVTRIAV